MRILPLPAAARVRRTTRAGIPIGRHATAVARVAALLLAGVLAAPAAIAQPAGRGQALYETRCIACHDRSVHRRESRRAGDFDALRREVVRWSATAGTDWRDEEIDAVTVFLNDRYYRFTCPPAVCPTAPRARLGR